MSRSWNFPRKILCATDLSPSCDRAVYRAIRLAREWNAILLLVHIVSDAGLQTSDFAATVRHADSELRRQVTSHPGAADIDLEVIVSQGNPAERILAKCDRLFVDLLVLGAGEKASFRQRLLGSTVDRILRYALQPVLTVRDHAHVAYRTMAVATDFSPPSKEALDCALAFFPNAKATVVHAYEDTLHGLLASDQVTGELAERHKIEMRTSVENGMHELVVEAQQNRPDLATVIEVGAPEAVMRRYAERHDPDLFVVGTHGRTGVRRAVIGSVAERLIGTMPRDVLAVRSAE
jgi:nucleotide-binding universal stress UspA family protein